MLSKPERILLWGANIWILGEGMLGPLFAVFTESIGGSILDISWAYSLYLVITGIGIVIVGKISDRVDKTRLMVAGYGLNAVLTFGYLLVSEPLHLFILQGLLGIALALAQPTWYALYDHYSGDGSEDGAVWGLSEGLGFLLAGVSLFIGGFLVDLFSFNILFVTMGLIQILATIYQARILKYSPQISIK